MMMVLKCSSPAPIKILSERVGARMSHKNRFLDNSEFLKAKKRKCVLFNFFLS